MNSNPSVSWEKTWDLEAWNDTARSWVKQKPSFSVLEDSLSLGWACDTRVCVCVVVFLSHTLLQKPVIMEEKARATRKVTFSGQHAWSPWDTPLPSLGPVRWLMALSLPKHCHAEFSSSCCPVCSLLSHFITCRAGALGVTWSLAVQNGFRPFSVTEGKCDMPLGFHLEKAFST